MEILAIWLMFAGVTAFAATQKNRSGLAWFFVGLVLGIFGLIAVAFAKALPEESAQ